VIKLSSWKTILFLCLFCALEAIASPAQTYTTLVRFNGSNGAGPWYGSLVQGFDGNLYGTTVGVSCCNLGTVFKMTPTGTLTTLYSFDGTHGSNPYAGLVLGTDGYFYGTTESGGVYNEGTVFKIAAEGTLTTLHSFDLIGGANPYSGLVQAANGNFYGTTESGGIYNEGTVFEITPTGTVTILHSFCRRAGCADGANPYAGLLEGTDGNFYGTTLAGGSYNLGTVFKITPAGTLTTLHTFDGTDGYEPYSGLMQANGNFYGTTFHGGSQGQGNFFKITAEGTLTTLHSFDGTDGIGPNGLVQATNGNFYGTTFIGGGGVPDGGTIFEITPAGTLTTLYRFCLRAGCDDGTEPFAGVVQATNGNFYGTTSNGGGQGTEDCGDLGCGTVYKLSAGLGAFVETLPTGGKDGVTVTILGANLTRASEVNFNGTSATFTVVSATEIKTTVPNSATTGFVTVSDPSGTLKSNKKFRVIPQITGFSPTSGPVDTEVIIEGISLKQTTAVAFDGVPVPKANITVKSDTEVIVKVPTGAKAGKISVTTPGGTATSSGTFTVT
jgi:uncharacterized repeat protein (TIGR03803 family)